MENKPNNNDKHNLRQLIIDLADQETKKTFHPSTLRKEREKVLLRSGELIDMDKVVSILEEKPQSSKPIFTWETEYYKEIFRLNGWKIDESKKWIKPWKVGKFTNEVIYSRFPQGVLTILREKNPYIGFGVRGFRHFQYLSEDARKQLEQFISEAVALMKEYKDWYSFRKKYYEKYGVTYQVEAFDKSTLVVNE